METGQMMNMTCTTITMKVRPCFTQGCTCVCVCVCVTQCGCNTIIGDLSETEEERNEAVARKDLEHYEFSCVTYKAMWEDIKQQVDQLHQELKVQSTLAIVSVHVCVV